MPLTRALATTVHDPDARLAELLLKHADNLRGAYMHAAAAVTARTSGKTLDALRSAGIEALVGDSAGIGASRRLAVATVADKGANSIHYCDLDRWLHWRESWPQELSGLLARFEKSRPAPMYACLGRTTRAFGTHPKVQVACEDATNRGVSAAFRRRSDVTAGSAWLSADGARLVLSRSVESSNATDGEWPAIAWLHDPRRVLQTWCEGLEFETATFHSAEVEAAGGRDEWIRATYDTPASWAHRLGLASATVAAVVRVLGTGETA